MKVAFEKYNPLWVSQFNAIKEELSPLLNHLEVQIEHIGSTSVVGLSAKPIIDIMIGVQSYDDLDRLPILLIELGYVYYENYNEDMPYRRFFVKLEGTLETYGFPNQIKVGEEVPEGLHNHDIRVANIHVIPISDKNWTRHIAFRDYLRTHQEVREEYKELKEKLSKLEWKDGNDYNSGKDSFIKTEEKKAIDWFLDKNK